MTDLGKSVEAGGRWGGGRVWVRQKGITVDDEIPICEPADKRYFFVLRRDLAKCSNQLARAVLIHSPSGPRVV
jgi:hypothetical protein